MRRVMQFLGTLMELLRVLLVLRGAETARRFPGIQQLLLAIRSGARRLPERTPWARRNLRRAIAWVDSLLPGGPNCYRRVLLEMMLDRGAASEPVCMGFLSDGDKLTGHVWLLGHAESSDGYQVNVRL